MAVARAAELVELVRKSGLVETPCLKAFLEGPSGRAALDQEPKKLVGLMIQEGLLTVFQAGQLLQGKWRGFQFGNYRVLEQLGRRGQSPVYLCAHTAMKRYVALKVLPLAEAENPAAVARFHREARAAAALDHPNIVHAYDSGTEGKLHYLVTAYVDGRSLQEIVEAHGPLDVGRAAHYVSQAAHGMEHIFQAGLVHRDIKPGNLLLDRRGVVRVLDMGLARFFHDHQDMLTVQYDKNTILGTADFLSPEQARDSHDVDIRTDIYSLGATFYFLLTGHPPFAGKTVTQKLICHQTREPTPVRQIRPDVPKAMAAVLAQMLAKDPAKRYPTPAAVARALLPWTRTPIAPPAENEMPQWCLAVGAAGASETGSQRVRIRAAAAAPRPERKTASALAVSTAPGRPDSGALAPAVPDVGAADTDEAMPRCDTDPHLSRIFAFGPSARLAPARRAPKRPGALGLVGRGLIGAATRAWAVVRWLCRAR